MADPVANLAVAPAADQSRRYWRRLRPEQRAAVREQERAAGVLSRLAGVRFLPMPQPGYWVMRVVKHGPKVPAAIVWVTADSEPGEPDNDMRGTRSPFLAAFIAGKPAGLERVWTGAKEPIDRGEYLYLLADLEHARQYRPGDPLATPGKPVDLMQAKLPF